MTQAATFAQDLTSAAFVVLALLTGLQWYRHRSRAQGMLTLALVFLGLVAIAGRVPQSPVLGALEIVAFMLSGWFVLLFRHEFIPLSTRAFRVALGLLAISIAAGLAAVTVLSGAGQAVITVVALILVGSWAVFVGEPIVRFWAASRGVPAVQRARMRSLSFGFAVLIAILVVDVIGGPALRSPLAIVITQLIALVTVPVIYVSLAPPLTLRRIWQMGEEDALRSATQDLLIFSPDRKTLAERACGWATRLMGAQGAFLVDEDGTVLATTGGMDSALVDRVVASRPGIAGGEGSQFITAPLHLARGTGMLGVMAGPYTPVFGSDEVLQLSSYANAVSVGLQRTNVTERMAALERSKSQFLNLASHELRGPMTVIRGYVSMFDSGILGQLNSRGKKAADVMEAKVTEMSALIEQMIESARLEEGAALIADLSVNDLRDIAQASIEKAQPLVDRRHELTLKQPRDPVEVRVDPERTQMIVTNLISNALKYSPRGGAVECEVTTRDGEALLSVKDEGIGIAPENMDSLFTRFGRVMTPETQHLPGTGLGLYLARQLARLQGGDVTVESRHGKGSTFTLHLPRTEGQPSSL